MVAKLYFQIYKTQSGLTCEQIDSKKYGQACHNRGWIPRAWDIPNRVVHYVAPGWIDRKLVNLIMADSLNEMIRAKKI